ncbi:MAG: SIMPL domain-containing protein [Candidatus Nealsonbacteria bacterium]|nr:SIMPL domain-containing protein [Candidatus Nealsonbacteria bacterium]
MRRPRTSVIVLGTLAAIVLAVSVVSQLPGQMGGSRAGVFQGQTTPSQPVAPTAAVLNHDAIENYVTIVGRAEIRVRASSIRAILALTSQGTTAAECMKTSREKEKKFVGSLIELGIPKEKIFMDFISMLPVYEWKTEQREGQAFLVEEISGYLVQSNAHVEVDDETQAGTVVQAAFEQGITDIISFDYWCDTLDGQKIAAQKKALAEAKRKAEMLLSAHFEKTPEPLNIHEKTEVVYPKSLYESFSNSYAETIHRNNYNRSLPEIHAFRPKNTHYRGFFAETDAQDSRLPMRPEISIVSTITCYYAAPGRVRETHRHGRD